ncbi:hypothetical protein BAS09_03785 [Elizabethkingia ursingii]|uniref:hypothetical protein n=1 Tax=Elizabethkingia TaxID=308865 RepID=UPI00099AE2D1|nr:MULTISPECIES: hypothetical protein [Elizabethkingia]OPC04819.1 hypothetical protein BAS09_03785 [Elizabethkingia ursingii]PUB26407.1 hypothetical protein C8J95_11191 [Elizabethkingia sp. YR214]
MKKTIKILAIAIATLGVVTTSCSSKRDEEHQTTKYNVTGNWQIMAYIDSLGKVVDHSKDTYYMEFDKDMSYLTTYLDQNVSGKYVYEGTDRIVVTTTTGKKIYYKVVSMNSNTLEITSYDPSNDKATEGFRLKRP